jgi:hypothetical protein
MRTYIVNLDVGELEALTKTIGIALDNLTHKVTKHGASSPIGQVANSDRRALLSAQTEILSALGEAYDV